MVPAKVIPNAPPNDDAILYIPAATPTSDSVQLEIAVSVDGVANKPNPNPNNRYPNIQATM